MNNSSTVCIDANIVVKMVIFPDDVIRDLWESWQGAGAQVAAPTLLYYEVVNSLHQYQKHGLLSAEAIGQALDTALDLPVTLIGDAELHRRACDLAATYHLPAAYDAHYLALAERLGVDLWTADARLVNTMQPFGVDWVKLVGS